jgi:predicted nucleic-acid-binding protein
VEAEMEVETVFADTNLFLRYLTNDVPAQADAVESLLQRAAKDRINLVTTSMVIAEIVWTLESYYELDKKEIQAMVLGILNTGGLAVIDSDLILQAIVPYADKNVDFIDAFNAAWMLKNDVNKIYTFVQKHFNRFGKIVVEVPK